MYHTVFFFSFLCWSEKVGDQFNTSIIRYNSNTRLRMVDPVERTVAKIDTTITHRTHLRQVNSTIECMW